VELWARFFRHAQIYSVDALIGGFRLHRDSLVLSNWEACNQIADEIIDAEVNGAPVYKVVNLFRWISRTIRYIPKVRVVWQRLVLNSPNGILYRLPGPDWPPVIEYNGDKWIFRR